jgi:hypothetical protein
MSANLLYRLLVASLWIFLGGTALAQQCPPGQIAYGSGPGLSTCGPDNRQQRTPQQPAEVWRDRYGAIYLDASKGAIGTSSKMPSRVTAEQAALNGCQAKGGINCKMEAWYGNGCVAYVVSDHSYVAIQKPKLDDAIQEGMQKCQRSGDASCQVDYTDCSLPVRIQ